MYNCGTISFLAPEVLRNVGYDSSIDMWSAGVLYHYMVCGTLPFKNKDKIALYENIKSGCFHDDGYGLAM